MELNTTASNNFSWKDVNWDALRRLRARFLQFDSDSVSSIKQERTDYWRSSSDLASYDFTFAERIGWKWDTVLDELKSRGWMPPEGTVLDYGCGTGVAGRRVVAAWPGQAHKLSLWDRSALATRFARERAQTTFPGLAVETTKPAVAPEILVVSHLLNELSPGKSGGETVSPARSKAEEQLLALAQTAQVILWVEPGTAAVSRAVISIREELIGQFRPIAPCTHAGTCGLLVPNNQMHWCHHFAKVPTSIFRDPGWGRFAQMIEVDLRSVPFSYLVLDRRPAAATQEAGFSRVIGKPRCYKGFDKVLSCQADGVHELTLQKRDAPELFKAMKKDPGSLYRWGRENDKIRSGIRIF